MKAINRKNNKRKRQKNTRKFVFTVYGVICNINDINEYPVTLNPIYGAGEPHIAARVAWGESYFDEGKLLNP
jgi:hypothetical protein